MPSFDATISFYGVGNPPGTVSDSNILHMFRKIILALAVSVTLFPAAHAQNSSGTSSKGIAINVLPDAALGIKSALDRIAIEQEKESKRRDDEKSDERPAKDLKAQEDMAFWARWSFVVVGASALISIFGLGGLLYSLYLNRKSLEASLLTVQAARDATAAQSRAWVSLKCEIIQLSTPFIGANPSLFFKLKLTLHNHGNSPATGLCCEAKIQEAKPYDGEEVDAMALKKFGEDEKTPKPGVIDDRPKFSLFPGETTVRGCSVFITQKSIIDRTISNGFSEPVIFLSASYETLHVPGTRQTLLCSKVVTHDENGLLPLIAPDHGWFAKLPEPIFLSPHATVFVD